MKNKQTSEDFNISDQNTKSNLFTPSSSRTFMMFWLALILCVSGFTITATAQQDGRRLSNAGESTTKASDGTWYLQRSQLGFTGVAFGTNDDQPASGAYLP